MSFLRISLVAIVFASTSFLGCEAGETVETSENAGSLRAIPGAWLRARGARLPLNRTTYYLARQDTRRCAFPICGGVWVSAVNQTVTRCPQGTLDQECYVSNLDFSTFDGPGDSDSTVKGALGPDFKTTRVVLQGAMVPTVQGFDALRVHMAWIATDTQPISGNFFGTRVNGIVCIVAPCPSFDQEILNRGTVSSFHGFDFTDVPAHADDSTYTGPALHSAYGLIVAGENIVDENAGPGGTGIFLKASQVFIPVFAPPVDPGRIPDARGARSLAE